MTLKLLRTVRKYRLTLRELEVMVHIANGKTSEQTALELGISIRTVDTHRTHIRRKTGSKNGADITRFAYEQGIVSGNRSD